MYITIEKNGQLYRYYASKIVAKHDEGESYLVLYDSDGNEYKPVFFNQIVSIVSREYTLNDPE